VQVMLYALRYETESSSALSEFKQTLSRVSVPVELIEVRACTVADILPWLASQLILCNVFVLKLVSDVLEYAGVHTSQRCSDLFGTAGAKGMIKKLVGNLKVQPMNLLRIRSLLPTLFLRSLLSQDIKNIYTQHTPLLSRTLDQLLKVGICVRSLSIIFLQRVLSLLRDRL
jgi:hypothetical protein